MAKFSPSDLLSPMKKMEKSLDEINQNTAALVSVVSGVSDTMGQYLEVITTQLDNIDKNLTKLVKTLSGKAATQKIKDVVTGAKEKVQAPSAGVKNGVALFKDFGIGAKEFSKAMLLFMLVPQKTGDKFKKVLTNVLEGIKTVKKEDVEKAEKFGKVGKAIFQFVGWVALAGLVAIPAAIVTPIIKFCIKGMIKVFVLLKEHEEDIKKGTDVLNDISIALGIFSIGMLAFGLTVKLLSWEGILMGAATVALFSLTAWLVGMVSDTAEKGAGVLIKVGQAVALFGLGLLAYGFAVKMLSMKSILIGAAAILVLTGVCAILGIPIVAGFVRLGAMILQAIVKPILIFALGLIGIGLALKLFDEETTKRIGPVIGGIGLAVAQVGLVALAAIPGAIALTAIGIALLVFTAGLAIFQLVHWTEDDTKNLVEAVTAVRVAFLGSDGKKEGIFSKIGGVIGGALDMVRLIEAAVGYATVALCLIVLSASLWIFKQVHWTEEDTKQLVEATTAVRIAFLGTDGKKEGIFDKIGGVIGGALDLVRMVEAAAAYATVAGSIVILSGGLAVFKQVGWDENDTKQLVEATTGVRTAFLGSDGKKEGIFAKIGGVVGGGLDLVRMVEAAGSFAAAGIALATLSGGLAAFKAVGWNTDLTKQLSEGLTGVRTAFLGDDKKNKKTGLFAKIGAVITDGLDMVRMAENATALSTAGIALILISKGLIKFKEVGWKDEYSEQLMKSIGAISSAFAQVSEQGAVKKKASFGGLFGKLLGGWEIEKNKVKDGIDSVKGAGKALLDISQGLEEFTKWYQKNRNLLNMEDGKSPFFEALKMTITSVGEAFAAVADVGTVEKDGLFGIFHWEENKAKVGIESVQGAGKALIDISEGILKFTEWYSKHHKELEMETGGSIFFQALKTTITSVGDAFAAVADIGTVKKKKKVLFLEFETETNKAKEGVESVQNAGEALMSISEGILKFTEFYVANRKMLDADDKNSFFFSALKNSIVTVGSAFAEVGGSDKDVHGFAKMWDMVAIRMGISSVMEVHKALDSITQGLITFTKFYKQNEDLLSTEDENSGLLVALKNTIVMTGTAFASIGGMQTERTDIMGQMFHWNENAVKAGIKSVMGVNVALISITNGIKTFVKSGVQTEDVERITMLLVGMGNGFGSLANIDLIKEGNKFTFFATRFAKGFETIYKKKDMYKQMSSVNLFLKRMERTVRLDIYNKTADGIKKIADAVNSIDIEKGQAFSDLFVAASKLKDNTRFYEDLMKAIEEIRDILAQNGMTGGEGGGQGSGSSQKTGGNKPAPQPTNNNRNANQGSGNERGGGPKTIQAGSVTIETSGTINVSGKIVNGI